MLAKNATSINYFRKYPSTRDPYIYGTLHETSRDSHRCNEIPLRNHHVCTIHPPPPLRVMTSRHAPRPSIQIKQTDHRSFFFNFLFPSPSFPCLSIISIGRIEVSSLERISIYGNWSRHQDR